MIGRFLCRIGIHRWRHAGFSLLLITEDVRCVRCGIHGYRYLGG